jgi:hypothetical protein
MKPVLAERHLNRVGQPPPRVVAGQQWLPAETRQRERMGGLLLAESGLRHRRQFPA